MTQLSQEDIKSNTQLLIEASENGDIECVKLLIPVLDPKADDSFALQRAAQNGHTECVKLLVFVSNLKVNSEALRCAAAHGQVECVKLLIPISDPKADDSFALQLAAESGHSECVKLLIPVSDYNLILKTMSNNNEDTTVLQQCIDEYEAQLLKNTLHQQLDGVVQIKQNSVKRKI